MVDFRLKQQFPIEAFIAASKKPNKFDRIRLAVERAESGLTKGLALSETISKIKQRRKQAESLSNFKASPQGKQFFEENQIPAELGDTLTSEQIVNFLSRKPEETQEQKDARIRREAIIKGEVSEEFAERKEKRGIPLIEKEAAAREGAKTEAKFEEASFEAQRDFSALETSYSELFAWKKSNLIETGGGGFIKGKFADIASDTFKSARFPATASLAGARVETAVKQVKIMTGSSRFVQSLQEQLLKSYPDESEKGIPSANKMKQSIRNTFGFMNAVRQAGIDFDSFTDEELADPDSEINKRISKLGRLPLTEEQKREIEGITKRVLATAPAEIALTNTEGDPVNVSLEDVEVTAKELGVSEKSVLQRASKEFDVPLSVLENHIKILRKRRAFDGKR